METNNTTTTGLTRKAINAHPTVLPLLEAWRTARDKRDRIEFDRRYSVIAIDSANAECRQAEKAYDAAVAALYAADRAAREGK